MFEGIQRGEFRHCGSLSSSSVTSESLIQIKKDEKKKYEQPPVSNALKNTHLSRGNLWNKMAATLEFQVKPGGLDQK